MLKYAMLFWSVMSERFLKFIPSKASMEFAIKYKNAFILLLIIAERARRFNGDPDGLKIGQCHLGNHKNYGMTEKEYRYAKKILIENGLIKIVLTNRTRKNKKRRIFFNSENFENGATDGATELTTTGTIVELCNSEVWDINSEVCNQQKGDRKGVLGATEGRLKGDKQEREESKEREEEEKKEYARTDSRPRSKDILNFNFDLGAFEGIAEKDLADWKLMYPHLDLQVETLKAAQWLKSNPSKSKKKNWRRYLTGWFQRGNDSAENKKAYKAAVAAPGADRRTKDVEGNPVENQYAGKF
jgi:hypothetical protein